MWDLSETEADNELESPKFIKFSEFRILALVTLKTSYFMDYKPSSILGVIVAFLILQ